MTINYSTLPEHMRDAARLYIEKGIPPGSFLQAVICNDLFGAFRRADDINQAAMLAWVRFFYNEAPSGCWGSAEHFSDWLDRGGMQGAAA